MILDASTVFDEVDLRHRGGLSVEEVKKALTLRFGHHLPQKYVEEAISSLHQEMEASHEGGGGTRSDGSKSPVVTKEEFEKISAALAEKCQIPPTSWHI